MATDYDAILGECQQRLESERKKCRRMPKEWGDAQLREADWLKGSREVL